MGRAIGQRGIMNVVFGVIAAISFGFGVFVILPIQWVIQDGLSAKHEWSRLLRWTIGANPPMLKLVEALFGFTLSLWAIRMLL